VEERHAKLIVRDDTISITDMDSRTGLQLNNKRVSREILKEDDQIKIGHTLLVFHQPMPPEPEEEPAAEESAAASAAARPAPAPKPFFQRWALLLPLLALLFVAMALVALLIFKAVYQPKASISVEDARKTLNELIQQRQWDEASTYLEQQPILPLPEEDFERYRTRIEQESRSARYAADAVAALGKDQFNSALDLLFKIPADSVYHQEISRQLLDHLENRVDEILDATELEPEDYSSIIDLSEKMLQVRPEYKPAMAYICLAYIGRKSWPEAARAARELIDTWPDAAEGYYYLALAVYWQGYYNDALIPVNEALRLAPDTPEYLFLRAKIEILMERLNDARLDLDQVLKQEPQWAAARDLYEKLTGKKPAVSVPEPDRTAEEEAQHKQILQQRRIRAEWDRGEQKARNAFTSGESEAAIQELERLQSRYPKSSRQGKWRELESAMKRIHALYENAANLAGGDFPAALAKWEEMRALEKEALGNAKSTYSQEAGERIAAFYVRRATEDVQRGEMARAYTLAGKALEWDADQAEAKGVRQRIEDMAGDYYREGFRLYQHGNLEDARKNWEEVCRLLSPESQWYRKAQEKLDELKDMK
jgi:tetratricopeptide (TPR) repeat protein